MWRSHETLYYLCYMLIAFTWNALLRCMTYFAFEITPWNSVVVVYGANGVLHFVYYNTFTKGNLPTSHTPPPPTHKHNCYKLLQFGLTEAFKNRRNSAYLEYQFVHIHSHTLRKGKQRPFYFFLLLLLSVFLINEWRSQIPFGIPIWPELRSIAFGWKNR